MKKTPITAMIFFTFLSVSGQKNIPEYGKIGISDLKMNFCSFESDANAMKLIDIEETDFDLLSYGTKLKIETRVRIKIFNEKGFKNATIRIPYLSKKGVGKIKAIKGIIYNLDESGNIVTKELDKKDFFKQKAAENTGMVTFTFPNVKPGSVIEYIYTRVEKNLIQIDPWIIQSEIPVAYSSAIINTPVTSELKEKFFGNDTFSIETALLKFDQIRRTTFYKENIPSFKSEPFMSSRKDNLMKMIFFLLPKNNYFPISLSSPEVVWKFVGNYLLSSEFFGGKIKKMIPGTEKIIDSAKKISSISERIKYLYESVKKQIPDKTFQTLYSDDIIEAWNKRSGNTADINLILLNLLDKAEITSYPLLVSTRENGKISKDFPSFSQLNGIDVVAMLDSAKYYVMDVSLKFQSLDIPPLNVLNREALLLKSDNINWFIISDNRPLLKKSTTIFCEIDKNGIVEGEASTQYYNHAKSYVLDSTINDDDNKEEKYFDKKLPGLKILSSKIENTWNDDEPLFETIDFTYQPLQTEDFYFFNPQLFSSKNSNPFISDERNTDIDFGCNQEIIYSININLPPNFDVEHLPGTITVRAPDSSILFTRKLSKQASTVYMTQILEIKRSVFLKEEYPGLKYFFNHMNTLMTEEIVLKKKK